MGFLPENVTAVKPDFKLFEDLWELLEGHDRKGVNINDLKFILQVIRGAKDPLREIDCEPVEGKRGLAKMVIFDQDGNLKLRKGGQAKFASRFRSFYINKLQAENSANYPRVAKPAENALEKEQKGKPLLSAKTLKYAEKRKAKLQTEGQNVVEHLMRKNTVM